jgi:hypothetical protein
MARPRKSGFDLPPCVYLVKGRYYFKATNKAMRDSIGGKWNVPLGPDLSEARRKWAELIERHGVKERVTFGNLASRPDYTRRGVVYVMRQGDAGPIKIGFCASAANLPGRVRDLQTGAAQRIEVLGSVAGSIRQERLCHQRLSERRLAGEWFENCSATLQFVEVLLAQGVRAALVTSEGIFADVAEADVKQADYSETSNVQHHVNR